MLGKIRRSLQIKKNPMVAEHESGSDEKSQKNMDEDESKYSKRESLTEDFRKKLANFSSPITKTFVEKRKYSHNETDETRGTGTKRLVKEEITEPPKRSARSQSRKSVAFQSPARMSSFAQARRSIDHTDEIIENAEPPERLSRSQSRKSVAFAPPARMSSFAQARRSIDHTDEIIKNTEPPERSPRSKSRKSVTFPPPARMSSFAMARRSHDYRDEAAKYDMTDAGDDSLEKQSG